MTTRRSLFLIFNPTAGGKRRDKLAQLIGLAQLDGDTVELGETKHAGHATQLAGTQAAQSSDVILVAGGDGTVNEVINGLPADSKPIGFAPFGTANVLAYELDYPGNFKRRMLSLLDGSPRPVQLAQANGQKIMLMASVGLDSLAVAGVDHNLKNRIGPFAYIWSGLKATREFLSGRLNYTVRIDNGPTTEAVTVIITRARKYGGPFVIAPDAGLDQDLLHVVLFRATGLRPLLSYAWGILTGRLHRQHHVDIRTARKVEVTGPRADPVQLDGDDAATLPLTVEMIDQKIDLIYPY